MTGLLDRSGRAGRDPGSDSEGGTRSDTGEDSDLDGAPAGWRRIGRRHVIVGVVALVIVAAIAVWLLFFSSVFGAKHVTVNGVSGAERSAVAAAARVDSSTPLLRLDTAAVEKRVEALPYVSSAVVRTSFPSTVTITVTPRVALGYVQVGDDYGLIDKTGKQFRTSAAQPAKLPKFVLPSGTAASAAGAAVATVAQAMSSTLLAQVESIQALDPTAITVLMRDSKVVHWGTSADSAQKAAVLPALLTQKGSVYDVSNPDQVFVR